MTITALPTPPSRANSPSVFATQADAMLGALPAFVTEANALAAAVNVAAASADADALTASNAVASAMAAGLADAETNAATATTQAGIATTKADIATTKAAEAAASAASISDGPVTSVNGMTGAVTIQLSTVTLTGNLSPYVTQTTALTITNYDSATTYGATATGGTVSVAGDTITYVAGATAGDYAITITAGDATRVVPVTVGIEPNSYITTPAATPSNFGDPFEGGFYAGMYWDQIAQASNSKTLATGTQTFTVPSMTGAPIVYAGQTLEVRSRANPGNKFVGTVTSAKGTTLTLNVTSIVGSGTFSDWSVMSRFRSIDAPKAGGEISIALKNTSDALPSECQSLVDGWAATEAMRLAGTSTVYPAAHWARALTIGGFNDWHIPARDVLELRWRNLKPTTTANYTTADRPTAQTFDYKINGAFGDSANAHGTNNNSSPTGAAYTSGSPAQTPASAFKTGGAEAYEFGSAYYWSCSEYSATNAWLQGWGSSNPGFQNNDSKTSTYRVRAVRRSII